MDLKEYDTIKYPAYKHKWKETKITKIPIKYKLQISIFI